MTGGEKLNDRIREWSGRDQVQQVFVNGYITNNTGAASAINEAMELLAAAQADNKRLRNVVEKAWALELHRRKHNGSITLGLIVDLSEALEEEALKETDDD